MRNFVTLDTVSIDAATGILQLTTRIESTAAPSIAMRREGEYIAIAASYGPLEIALRPHYDALRRALTRLKPIGGLQSTRQIGTGQTYLSVGLQPDNVLLLRPTIVGDAAGHIVFNLAVTAEARAALFDWLGVPAVE